MSKVFIDIKFMQRVNICNVDPSFSRPLQLMAAHSFIKNNQCFELVRICGFCLFTRLLRIDYTFSMGSRSGEFPGHGLKMFMFCSTLLSLLPYGKVLSLVGKGIARHQPFLGWLGEVALGGYVGIIL